MELLTLALSVFLLGAGLVDDGTFRSLFLNLTLLLLITFLVKLLLLLLLLSQEQLLLVHHSVLGLLGFELRLHVVELKLILKTLVGLRPLSGLLLALRVRCRCWLPA